MLSTITGNSSFQVYVDYEVDDYGYFKSFYVLINTEDGPVDIAGYLHPSQIDSLQYEAQMQHMEEAINLNESNMS